MTQIRPLPGCDAPLTDDELRTCRRVWRATFGGLVEVTAGPLRGYVVDVPAPDGTLKVAPIGGRRPRTVVRAADVDSITRLTRLDVPTGHGHVCESGSWGRIDSYEVRNGVPVEAQLLVEAVGGDVPVTVRWQAADLSWFTLATDRDVPFPDTDDIRVDPAWRVTEGDPAALTGLIPVLRRTPNLGDWMRGGVDEERAPLAFEIEATRHCHLRAWEYEMDTLSAWLAERRGPAGLVPAVADRLLWLTLAVGAHDDELLVETLALLAAQGERGWSQPEWIRHLSDERFMYEPPVRTSPAAWWRRAT